MPLRIKCDFPGRVESGAVEFEYSDGNVDWSGLFIRGDHAAYLALKIEEAVETLKSNPDMMFVVSELELIKNMIYSQVIVGGPPDA